jgi:hypothetical protein
VGNYLITVLWTLYGRIVVVPLVCNKRKNKHIAEQIDLFYNVNLKMPFCESDLYKFITKIQKKTFLGYRRDLSVNIR